MAGKNLVFIGVFVIATLVACGDSAGRQLAANSSVSSCMLCHNGAKDIPYAGPGIENPHPFPGASDLQCHTCHGGNPDGADKAESHVPPPPQIGDRAYQDNNNHAYFNRLTLTGIDKFPDYTVDGMTYTAIDFLQFINPGDLRVVNKGRACGRCHSSHVETVEASPIATSAGIFGGAAFSVGVDNRVPAQQGMHEDTAADTGFRAVTDASAFDPSVIGSVPELIEYPVYSTRNDPGPMAIHGNPEYDVANLEDDVDPVTGQAITDSALANLLHEQMAFTCGDCHLGSAGANNRTGDYRSSGCAACHMPYSVNGRSTSGDPNIPRDEPYDPDNIDDPEQPHVRRHLIVSTARTLSTGEQVQGMDDYTCAGCHQGSNRTVMQYWGIRLDQNADVVRGRQYPAQPYSRKTTSGDARLFGFEGRPDRGNNRQFNGRNANQYLLEEDYDDDDKDDTPPDVHYEAGMGCIDCHNSFDLHGGDPEAGDNKRIVSRMHQAVAIRCESCHGGVDAYANSKVGQAYDGQARELATDANGRVLDHVVKEGNDFYLYSKLTGNRHYVPQTRDTVVNSQKKNPFTDQDIYTAKASYAMGRDDDSNATGIGPQQVGNATPSGFAHSDSMDCASCHASWTNTCLGCHLWGEYANDFSNITGDRIVFREDEADFVYQSPVFMSLAINAKNKITQASPNTKMFFRWKDRNGSISKIYTFSNRKGKGNSDLLASLGHNAMMSHSIRGKVGSTKEGPRYCVSCHLTTDGLQEYGDLYNTFRTAMATSQFDQLDFGELRKHFGQNTSNRYNSPLWVHMVAGLGTGLFLFDEDGCPINPLDNDDQRKGCDNVAPAAKFDLTRVKYNLDRVVDANGVPTGSSNQALNLPRVGPNRRDGAPDPNMAGPLGAELIRRLTDPDTGIVLDSWMDANGNVNPALDAILNPPPAPPQTTGK
jgi:hypothetical protein